MGTGGSAGPAAPLSTYETASRRRGMRLLVLAAAAALTTACGRLDELKYEPPVYPDQWCSEQPCVQIGGTTLSQPLGSTLVFTLAILWVAAGVYFLVTRRGQNSRLWFGIALVLGGIGAASAGISYQAFGYGLKCAGRSECVYTDGFELAYSFTQAVSVSCMLAAVAYACMAVRARRWVFAYASLNVIVYAVLLTIGAMAPNRAMLSFEVLMLFAVPGIIGVLVIAVVRVRQDRQPKYKAIARAAVLLVLVQVAYFAYSMSGLTETLWDNGSGFYFSENDVLHVGMIVWLAYVTLAIGRSLTDYQTPVSAGVHPIEEATGA